MLVIYCGCQKHSDMLNLVPPWTARSPAHYLDARGRLQGRPVTTANFIVYGNIQFAGESDLATGAPGLGLLNGFFLFTEAQGSLLDCLRVCQEHIETASRPVIYQEMNAVAIWLQNRVTIAGKGSGALIQTVQDGSKVKLESVSILRPGEGAVIRLNKAPGPVR